MSPEIFLQCRIRTPTVNAIQFQYIDGPSGPKTRALAEVLGLSRHRSSQLWEARIVGEGWQIVWPTNWAVFDKSFSRSSLRIFSNDVFEELFEIIAPQEENDYGHTNTI